MATTLLDADQYPANELANLYRRRWQAELHLRSLKVCMQMDHLRSKKPATVCKEFHTHLLAYNLIRGIMLEAAATAGVAPYQLSFQGAVQSFNAFLASFLTESHHLRRYYAALVWMVTTHRVADRPDRIEPRLVKKRPKKYARRHEPRAIAKKRLTERS